MKQKLAGRASLASDVNPKIMMFHCRNLAKVEVVSALRKKKSHIKYFISWLNFAYLHKY
jgi:hypothetical protein